MLKHANLRPESQPFSTKLASDFEEGPLLTKVWAFDQNQILFSPTQQQREKGLAMQIILKVFFVRGCFYLTKYCYIASKLL